MGASNDASGCGVCSTGVILEDLSQFQEAQRVSHRKLLIANGEMSELKGHAWKLIPLARADAHRNAPTPSRSTTSRNNDVRRPVHVIHRACLRFRGYRTQF